MRQRTRGGTSCTHHRLIALDICALGLIACALLTPATVVAECDEPDAPDCTCFVDGGEWDPGGPAVYPFTVFIQDVARESLPLAPGLDGVEESCACPGWPGCTWDPDTGDPDNNFDNSGKPYWQMVLGANSEVRALSWAELMADGTVTIEWPEREAWCSETVSYWHRESAIPYLRGYLSDWWETWRISRVADLKLWYETAEGSGGRGRWINATEISYSDFELGVTVPVPGSYIAVAEYDDMTNSYPDMIWSHSQIVDEMTVHRDGHGNVFQVEITLLEGNSGNRVRDDRRYDDLLTVTPQGSGWSHHFAGDDGIMGTADDIRRKIYGVGVDLDQFGQPYYDPARLHEVDHPGMLRAVLPSPVTTTDDDWEDYSVILPWLIQYAVVAQQKGGSRLKSGLSQSGFQPLPNGEPENELYVPDNFVGTITMQFPAPHPLPIEGIELTWAAGSLPMGYTVDFYYDDGVQQGMMSGTVPDLANFSPSVQFQGLPVMVPVVMDAAMANVVAVQLFFPDGSVPPDTVLSDIAVRFEGAPWDDAPSETLDVQRSVFVDIKPCSCPNSFNPKKKGVLPVAILGTFDFDVTTVDPATVMVADGATDPIAPLRWAYEDVATPYVGGSGAATSWGATESWI